MTDLPLTPRGERNAVSLGERLSGLAFEKVFTSPLQRASRTCELAGFGDVAEFDRDLVEWNYGDYEGKTPDEIHVGRPAWLIFRDGCPNGESVSDVVARANRVIDRVRAIEGGVLIFSSGQFLRVLGACWVRTDPTAGRYLYLGTAALSAVGFSHGLDDPVIRLWNDRSHAEV
jgi:probable phosphoglycerate mutase